MNQVTDASFATNVLQAEQPVLAYFRANWSSQCTAGMDQQVNDAANAFSGKLNVVALDVDANPATFKNYGVVSVPVVMLFAGGQRQSSYMGITNLMNWLGRNGIA